METYSLKTGLWKGIKFALIGVSGLVVFTGFSDLTLWGLLETYLKPALGSLSVGGVIAFALNWMKNRTNPIINDCDFIR